MQVDSNGRIVIPDVQTPPESAPIAVKGSPITAAASEVAAKTAEQATAVNKLGGKLVGGAEVEVKNIPNVPTAGGSDPSGVFAKMMELKAQVMEQGKYDGLGSAPPMMVAGKRSRKHKKNAKRKHTRKHRGAARKSRRVHHSRRRVHTRRR